MCTFALCEFATQAAVHQTNSETHLVLYWSMKEHKDKVADALKQRKCQLAPSKCRSTDLPDIFEPLGACLTALNTVYKKNKEPNLPTVHACKQA